MTTAVHTVVIPAALTDSSAQLSSLLNGAGLGSLDEIGWIRITGTDRVRWLNGMVTNSIQNLAPGEGCYNFVLNAQGRIQGDLIAFLIEDSILLETSRSQIPALLAHLDHFIIMDDVELADISESRNGILIAGPKAASLLGKLDLAMGHLSPLRLQSTIWNAAPLDMLYAHSPIIPRIELWSDHSTIQQLTQASVAAGATPISPETLDQLRILEGTPRYGTDIRNSETTRDLPQETAQTRALHFTKGCYLGQEIVERIRSRGNVHRTFTGFELIGALPASGALLEVEGKPAGEITSVAAIQLPESAGTRAKQGALQLALGYVRREALADAQARGLSLEYPGGTATPIVLPYPIS